MAQKRQPISKRTRFEVFKRDRFTCQYCGNTPPTVTLQIDHIVPVSKGGDNSRVNLVTACRDCNLGKSNVDLDVVIPAVERELASGQERIAQLKAFNRLLKAERREQDQSIAIVAEVMGRGYINVGAQEERSVRIFLARLSLDEVLEAADVALSKGNGFRYFCGVCWSKIKEKQSDV